MSAPHLAAPRTARTAQAVRTTGGTSIDQLVFHEVAVPEPGPGQVLVAIKAVSLNYRDLAVVTGRYPRDASQPTTIASDGSGQVIAVGDGVTAFKPGDRVVGSFFRNGSPARLLDSTAHRRWAAASMECSPNFASSIRRGCSASRSIELCEAATLPCAGLTAWNALVPTAHVQAGDTVLLLGTGGVSIFGLQFAKLHGARVIITSSSDEKLARAKALGADETINYKTHPDWDKEVLRLTGGQGVDIVLEVGGGETFRAP